MKLLCILIKLAGFLESLMIFLGVYFILQTGLLKQQSISKNDNKEMDIIVSSLDPIFFCQLVELYKENPVFKENRR